MASKVLEIYRKRADELDVELAEEGHGHGPHLQAARSVSMFATARLRVTSSIPESRKVQESTDPAIVISSSGMATGGRVLHHLRQALPDARNTVMFAGFQAEGTRGRALLEGAKFTRIHGEEVPVRAHIANLDFMSAHADANEIMRWLGGFTRPPSLTCLVHGESGPMDVLKARIEKELGWTVKAPAYQEKMEL